MYHGTSQRKCFWHSFVNDIPEPNEVCARKMVGGDTDVSLCRVIQGCPCVKINSSIDDDHEHQSMKYVVLLVLLR